MQAWKSNAQAQKLKQDTSLKVRHRFRAEEESPEIEDASSEGKAQVQKMMAQKLKQDVSSESMAQAQKLKQDKLAKAQALNNRQGLRN